MRLRGLRLPDLFLFSIPSIASAVIEPLAGMVDTSLVGHYDTQALAALAVAVSILSTVTWMFYFVVQVSTQAVAHGQVAKNPRLLCERVKISLSAATIVGLSCTVVLMSFKDFFFSLAGGHEQLRSYFDLYYDRRVLFHLVTVLAITLLSLLRGFGRLQLVFVLMSVATGANIAASWFFLYQWNWGLAAIAWGTIGSYALVCIAACYFLFQDERLTHFFSVKMKRENWFIFGKHSFALFGRSLFLSQAYFFMTKCASALGTNTLAAHQIILQLWLFVSYFLDGLALSGSLLGAKFFFLAYLKRTKLVFRQLIILSGLVGLGASLVFLLFPHLVWGLFSSDVLVHREIIPVWPVIVVAMIPNTLAFVYDGFLFGLEAFSYVRNHMVIGVVFFFAPLCAMSLWAAPGQGLVWIWLAMAMLNTYRLLSSSYYLRKTVP